MQRTGREVDVEEIAAWADEAARRGSLEI